MHNNERQYRLAEIVEVVPNGPRTYDLGSKKTSKVR